MTGLPPRHRAPESTGGNSVSEDRQSVWGASRFARPGDGWADVGRGLTLAPEPGVRPVDVVRTWERLGVDPGRVGDVGLTAAGSHDPAVLRTLRRDAEELAARLAELRG